MSARFRLSVMMFLQYAIWGAWAPVLSDYLINKLGFSGAQVGVVYSLLPLATILSPFIGGQIADRYFPTQKVIAFLQLLGGVLLIYTSTVTNYSTLVGLMLFYSLLYAPTLALTNSIAFIHLENSEKEFGIIRVWGTIGWIVAGLSLAGWRYLGEVASQFSWRGDTLFLAGLFSIIMGFYSFKLPHTPPQKEAAKPWAFLEALKMLRDKNFLIFMIISFVVATTVKYLADKYWAFEQKEKKEMGREFSKFFIITLISGGIQVGTASLIFSFVSPFLASSIVAGNIGKIGGMKRVGGRFVETRREQLLHHSFSGVGILMAAGLPDEVVHAVALHSKDGEGRRATPEAVLLHHIDFMNYESLALRK